MRSYFRRVRRRVRRSPTSSVPQPDILDAAEYLASLLQPAPDEDSPERMLSDVRDAILCSEDRNYRREIFEFFGSPIQKALDAGKFELSQVRNSLLELYESTCPALEDSGSKVEPLYEPLADGEIRLLTIVQHEGNSAVCRLITYPRWLFPEFDAVSYCWGEETETTTISCNGCELEIRKSLFVALKYFFESRPPPHRPVWIDAICLNQRDDKEKAVQVPVMGEVYTIATRTVVWLGLGNEESDNAFQVVEFLHRKLTTEEVLSGDQVERTQQDIEAQVPDHSWDALKKLFRRPWFTRLWVVQEAALSSDINILCGKKSLDWSMLASVIKSLQKSRENWSKVMIEPDLTANKHVIPLTQQPIYLMHQMEAIRSFHKHKGWFPLFPLVDMCETRQCKEPVDRIWALLGLVSPALVSRLRQAGIVDYSESGKREYWKSYLAVMQHLYALNKADFWLAIATEQGLEKSSYLPSWCPDWNAPRAYTDTFHLTKGGSALPGVNHETRPDFSLLLEDMSLSMPGFEIDTVRTVIPFSRQGEHFYVPQNHVRYLQYFYECSLLALEVFGPSDQAVETFVRTLLQSDYVQNDPSSRPVDCHLACGKLFDYCKDCFEASSTPHGQLEDNIESTVHAREVGSGRVFFSTDAGSIGYGPPNTKEGDRVCFFKGAIGLFVLRSVDEGSTQTHAEESDRQEQKIEKSFMLIGDAYIDGLVLGKADSASDRGPDRQFVLV